jgi:hypothetical protein
MSLEANQSYIDARRRSTSYNTIYRALAAGLTGLALPIAAHPKTSAEIGHEFGGVLGICGPFGT